MHYPSFIMKVKLSDVIEKSAGKKIIMRLPFRVTLLRKVLCTHGLAG
jgi:hypothetical protein